MKMKSNMAPYVIAGSVVGGAAAYLLLTDSGRRMRRSMRNLNADSIPNKIEQLRNLLERRTQDLNRKIDAVKGRVSGSLEVGRRAFGESDETTQNRLRQLEETNGRVVSNIHRSIDELNRTVFTLERSVLTPVFQAIAVIRGVRRGMGSLKSADTRSTLRPVYDKERVNAF